MRPCEMMTAVCALGLISNEMQAHNSFLLPPLTTYIAVGLASVENVVNDSVDPEFDGHYADNVSPLFQNRP